MGTLSFSLEGETVTGIVSGVITLTPIATDVYRYEFTMTALIESQETTTRSTGTLTNQSGVLYDDVGDRIGTAHDNTIEWNESLQYGDILATVRANFYR